MASSDRTPPGLRRSDTDETEGRLLYRQRADAEARMQMAMTRRVSLADAPQSGVTAPDAELGPGKGSSVAESGSTASPKSDSACQSEGGEP